ncbi:auxin-induced protein X10A-like [Manihot esculenta]|uniref:Uncharacterized protein n=1 Tax=Manihot esculenta TaxID=3983 RepID=A0ACB7HTL2_MANES|nr:auxin-induced protein X10A-like [Manihot esculenta]KAG8655857.1 hypothetical protein MANES_04G081712v8 [Manihot esculenta]
MSPAKVHQEASSSLIYTCVRFSHIPLASIYTHTSTFKPTPNSSPQEVITSSTCIPNFTFTFFIISAIFSSKRVKQIAMAIRFPAITHAKQLLHRSNMLQNQSASNFKDVPKGHLAVYVGEDQKKRFIVPVSLLNKPSFQELLRKAEEEFGFSHSMGAITIPCREDIFIDLTSRLNRS